MENVKKLLNPRTIAVVGVSRNKEKIGRIIFDNILKKKFIGKVFPVNPKIKKIAGLKCFSSLDEIEEKIDLVVIAIPKNFIKDLLQKTKKKISSVVIITSGFSEIGEKGESLEKEILNICKDKGISILGPNCLGFINTDISLNATFSRNIPKNGKIAFISQSGALGTAALDWFDRIGLGFKYFISIGNKIDLNENDFLKYLASCNDVKAIGLYLEDFSNGHEFMEIVSAIDKPIFVLKPGKSSKAKEALSSHTGAMAEDDLIVTAALNQCGAIRVNSIRELFYALEIFSKFNKLDSPNIGIITNSGGPGVISSDEAKEFGLNVANLDHKTQKLLQITLPEQANVKNPIDVLGDAKSDRYKTALEHLLEDKNISAVLFILAPQLMTEIEKTAEVICKIQKSTFKPIVVAFLGGSLVEEGRKIMRNAGILTYEFTDDAIKSLSFLSLFTKISKEKSVILPYIRNNRAMQSQKNLDPWYIEKLLKKYKIPVLKSRFTVDLAQARQYAQKVKYPVVMKLAHSNLMHKTEFKAVRLNIQDKNQLDIAFKELCRAAERLKLKDYKIQIQPFITDGVEIIVGVNLSGGFNSKRGGFGHTIAFGWGGIYAEIIKDFSLKICPLREKDVDQMISQTKIGRILSGARGKKYNVEKVKQMLINLNQLIIENPEIKELDINPLFVQKKDVFVCDVKMVMGC